MVKNERTKLEHGQISKNKLSRYLLLFCSKTKKKLKSLNEVDPAILSTYEKLGIPLEEQKRLAGVAVDYVFDSTSVATTFKDQLSKLGIIFCSFSEAVQKNP